MRPFSVGEEGKAINLFHLRTKQIIRNARLKNQCAKDYFYGDDLVIEKELQAYEGKYASIIKDIVGEKSIEYEALEFLRDFSYLQYLRTDIAARRRLLAGLEVERLAFDRAPEDSRPPPLSQKQILQDVMRTFQDTVAAIQDLKVCLIRNSTRSTFVTSDDPAALVNRLYAQRLKPELGFGIGNAGVMFFLPVSPKFAVCAYDGGVYTCPDNIKNVVDTKKESDVDALNVLQFLKAAESIYFADWPGGEALKARFEQVETDRPNAWHKVHLAVRDETKDQSGTRTFREVHSESEWHSAENALVHLKTTMLDPRIWCSKIEFRSKPIFIETKTGAGYLRRKGQSPGR